MFTRRHVQGSPSVTLEKGVVRLRPKLKPNLRTIHDNVPSAEDRRAAAVVASLAFAMLLAVCFALYLLNRSDRWDLSPLPFLFSSELVSSTLELSDSRLTPLPAPRVTPSPLRAPLVELLPASEQFISYLPHSGFHNQRIALENALVLAHILNRTLLLPPVILGDPALRYRPSDSLREDLALVSYAGLGHCVHANTDFVPEECMEVGKHTFVPWAWFVTLEDTERQYGIRLLPRADLTDAFFARLDLRRGDTFFINDTTPYQFRLFDRVEDIAPLGPRYTTRINIPDLLKLAGGHRLLQFGTLFGTSRLRLSSPEHVTLRQDVRRAMMFTNKGLLARAERIRKSEALRGGYVAVHMRLGDGVFKEGGGVREVWWRLVRGMGISEGEAENMEKDAIGESVDLMNGSPQTAALRLPYQPISPHPACKNAAHPLLRVPLYIATDTPTHPALALFTSTFSCVHFLTDFRDLLEDSAPTAHSTHTSISPLDLDPPAHLLVPFIDALITSGARVVVGTPGSTFSAFVEGVLWRGE